MNGTYVEQYSEPTELNKKKIHFAVYEIDQQFWSMAMLSLNDDCW